MATCRRQPSKRGREKLERISAARAHGNLAPRGNNRARPSSVTLSQSQPAPDLCCMPSRLILSSRFSRQGTNNTYFLFPIWLSRLGEDVVEPDRRRLHYIRMLPGFPGIERLRLSGDKAPINGGDVMGFGNRQDGV